MEPLQPADPNAMVAYIPPPALPQNTGARLQKPRKLKPSPPPPQPMVAQMIEMGFSRSKVEFAIKALGEETDFIFKNSAMGTEAHKQCKQKK